jgi:hypothetical protein
MALHEGRDRGLLSFSARGKAASLFALHYGKTMLITVRPQDHGAA